MSRAKAIRAKCSECIADRAARGTELQQITDCESTSSPLWVVGPTTEITEQAVTWS